MESRSTPQQVYMNIEQTSEITQFQQNHISVLLFSKLIQHTKYTKIFSTKASFQQFCY